jgi:hypothetical protein
MFLSLGSLARSMTNESTSHGVFAVLYPVFHGSSIRVSQHTAQHNREAKPSEEEKRDAMLRRSVTIGKLVAWTLGEKEEANRTLRDE